MGFSGVVVVAFTGRSLIELNSISEVTEGIEGEDVRGEWRVGWFPGSELAEDSAVLLETLVAETGAPALTFFVIDSNTVVVEGQSSPGGLWRGCLAWEPMQAYCDEDGSDFAGSYLAPEAAAQAAAVWASAAGLQTDKELLLATFTVASEMFAEQLIQPLLDGLGIPPIGTPPRAVGMPAPTRPKTSSPRTPKHPLDLMLRDYVTPLMKREGFTKSARWYRLEGTRGDCAMVGFAAGGQTSRDVYPFSVVRSLLFEPLLDFWGAKEQSPALTATVIGQSYRFWDLVTPADRRPLLTTHPLPQEWEIHAGNIDLCGTTIVELLEGGALAQIRRLLDRRHFVDYVRSQKADDPDLWRMEARDVLDVGIDDLPIDELEAILALVEFIPEAAAFEARYRAWVSRRLAERRLGS